MTAEDFLDKLKKAAEQAAQQRQQQRQHQPQPTSRQRHQQAPQQSQQQQRQAAAQPTNEPPQLSLDFGTPEATAKIAAKAGFLDVVGIKLGMPVKEAVEALKAHNKDIKLTSLSLRKYEALPGVVMTPAIVTSSAPNDNPDHISVQITYTPNEAFVWGISHNLGFGREEKWFRGPPNLIPLCVRRTGGAYLLMREATKFGEKWRAEVTKRSGPTF